LARLMVQIYLVARRASVQRRSDWPLSWITRATAVERAARSGCRTT
jgi:hypothetical protein